MVQWEYQWLQWFQQPLDDGTLQRLTIEGFSDKIFVPDEIRRHFQSEDGPALAMFGYLSFLSLEKKEVRVLAENLEDTIVKLGLDGWELATHSSYQIKGKLIQEFYFKRPKQSY